MKEIILYLTAGGVTLGLSLTSIFASIMIFREAYDEKDWGYAVLGMIMLSCVAMPAFGLFASLFFIGG